MRSVTYLMGVSLDGYIVGPDGDFAWTAPDKEQRRHSALGMLTPAAFEARRTITTAA